MFKGKCPVLVALLFLWSTIPSLAQVMTGKVYDIEDGQPIEDAVIHNIHTNQVVYSDAGGNFSINARKGELVEFKSFGYKVYRIRLHGNPAKYYNIGMVIGPFEIEELFIYGKSPDRKVDSIKTAEVFHKALSTPRLEGADAFYHPISALSKQNRRIWAFQKRYYETERDKYIESVFSDKLIMKLSGLGEDSLAAYKLRFRPTFMDLTEWSEYEYYVYIKRSVETFRMNAKYYIKERD